MAAARLQTEDGSVLRTYCGGGGKIYLPDHGGRSSSSLQRSPASYSNFSTSESSPTSPNEALEGFAALDPYLRAMVRKEVPPKHMNSGRESETSQFSQQIGIPKHELSFLQGVSLLPDNKYSSQIGNRGNNTNGLTYLQEGSSETEFATCGVPFHQLPGWTQHGTTGDWQQNPYTDSLYSEGLLPIKPIEDQWNFAPSIMSDMLHRTTMELPSLNHLLHPGTVSLEDYSTRQQQLEHPADVKHAHKKAARMNRILLRQKSMPHQRGLHGTTTNGGASSSLNSPRGLRKMSHSNRVPRGLLLSTSQGQGRNMETLRFLLHKVLQPSDVNSLGRIVLSKKEAEANLPYLDLKEGILLPMEDFDTEVQWTFRYRFWPNNKSRMYLLESTGEFVRAHQLTAGDILVVYRNILQGSLVVRGRKNVEDGHGYLNSDDNGREQETL